MNIMADIIVPIVCIVTIIVVFFFPYHVLAVGDAATSDAVIAKNGRGFYSYYTAAPDGKQYECLAQDGKCVTDMAAPYMLRKHEILPDQFSRIACGDLDEQQHTICKQPVDVGFITRVKSRFAMIDGAQAMLDINKKQYPNDSFHQQVSLVDVMTGI